MFLPVVIWSVNIDFESYLRNILSHVYGQQIKAMKSLVKDAQQGDRLFFHCTCGAFYPVYHPDFTIDRLIPLVSGHSRELTSRDSDHNSVNDKDQGVTVLFVP
jgi:hypothetical protein